MYYVVIISEVVVILLLFVLSVVLKSVASAANGTVSGSVSWTTWLQSILSLLYTILFCFGLQGTYPIFQSLLFFEVHFICLWCLYRNFFLSSIFALQIGYCCLRYNEALGSCVCTFVSKRVSDFMPTSLSALSYYV